MAVELVERMTVSFGAVVRVWGMVLSMFVVGL